MALYLRELVRSWRQGRQYRRAMNRGAVSLRKRLENQKALEAHLIDTHTFSDGRVLLLPGHVEAREHDGLPRHWHDQRSGAPVLWES